MVATVIETALQIDRRMLLPGSNRGVRTVIPQHVRAEVWQRNRGGCVQCQAIDYLEFDHIHSWVERWRRFGAKCPTSMSALQFGEVQPNLGCPRQTSHLFAQADDYLNLPALYGVQSGVPSIRASARTFTPALTARLAHLRHRFVQCMPKRRTPNPRRSRKMTIPP